jgi:hypothetical protein
MSLRIYPVARGASNEARAPVENLGDALGEKTRDLRGR